jgi:hypothetical protein
MVMISHEYVSKDIQTEPLCRLGDGIQKRRAISIVQENVPPFVSPRQHMVQGTFVFDPPCSRHKRSLTGAWGWVKK